MSELLETTQLKVLYLEPFDGGSHAAFGRALQKIPAEWTSLTLPARHWKWRMRGAAAYFALHHGPVLNSPQDLVFASSYVALAELRGLCPRLASVPTILYFHENQLDYPVRRDAERDHHFGFTQLVSALAADACWFNSHYNLESFLGQGAALVERMPDAVPPEWIQEIRTKSRVMPVPVDLPDSVPPPPERQPSPTDRARGPLLLWNHRWEHDKGPDALLELCEALMTREVPFRLAVCGRRFRNVPASLEALPAALGTRLIHFGPIDDRAEYWAMLARADIALSTAEHEFFGISVIEAAWMGARPLVPNRLAYPEIFAPEHRYDGIEDAVGRLSTWVRQWQQGASLRGDRRSELKAHRDVERLPRYADEMLRVARGGL